MARMAHIVFSDDFVYSIVEYDFGVSLSTPLPVTTGLPIHVFQDSACPGEDP
jgi:hypothetical protein